MDQQHESRFIGKIENDVDEKLYDLLIKHLDDITKHVPVNSKNKEKLIKILDNAILGLRTKINKYTEERYNRYILIISNRILRYDKSRKDLKELKMDIIDEFIHQTHTYGQKIPLEYQINELRITYDTSYAFFLIDRFIEEKDWANAIYFLIACQLLEPDDERIDEYYKKIRDNIKPIPVFQKFFRDKGLTIVLDSNIIIHELERLADNLTDINARTKYKRERINFDKISKSNKLIITNSVKQELEDYMDYKLNEIRKSLANYKFDNIRRQLTGLLHDFDKYLVDNGQIDNEVLKKVKDFYRPYLSELEKITKNKLKYGKVSKKLKKLAQRVSLLPEKGDLNLIAEVIKLNEQGEHYILTNDQDILNFSGNLLKEFGVKVYR